MKRNLLTIQFIEDGLIILNKNKLIKYTLNSINNCYVINKELFIEEISKIIEYNKINNNLLTDNIKIIVDSDYSDLYLSNLKDIFKELSFNKIDFMNIKDIFKPRDNELFIDISNKSIKIISKDTIYKTNVYYSKYKQILLIYIKTINKHHPIKTIYLYGTYTYTDKFIAELEKICKIKTYIYTKPELIPIKLLI